MFHCGLPHLKARKRRARDDFGLKRTISGTLIARYLLCSSSRQSGYDSDVLYQVMREPVTLL
jgi:hypothetical protein